MINVAEENNKLPVTRSARGPRVLSHKASRLRVFPNPM